MPNLTTLTKKQQRVYEALKTYIKKHRVAPTIEELQKELKVL